MTSYRWVRGHWRRFTVVTVLAGLVAAMLVTIGVAGAVERPVAPLATGTGTDYQAEDATIYLGQVNSDHTGYTGTGFVNYDNVIGGYVEWTVTADQAGSTTIGVRYANGTTTNRPMDITVNGALVVDEMAYPPTGTWDSWATATAAVTLNAGSNTIRATATTAGGGPNVDKLTVGYQAPPPPTDWSVAVVESTMRRYTPATLGGWTYTTGLYLYGQYLVYQRTHDPRYLQYIKDWADRFVDPGGNISQSFDSLDSMQSGNILLILSRETGERRYRKAADKIRQRLNTYPRTSDGAWWHADSDARQGQLWADGSYMVNPFVIRYGQQFNDAAWGNDESTHQLQVYAKHLQRTSGAAAGLLYHAYDEPGGLTASWVHPEYGYTNGVSWCRGVGWYGMATVDVLDLLPADHPARPALVGILRGLVDAYARLQDPATGRWFQVVDDAADPRDWTETSCSAMYTFTISRAVQRGWVDPGYGDIASKGYQGVLANLSTGTDGLTYLRDVCVGTSVSDSLSYYFDRTRATNDFHGLGAFLIMNEQMARTGGA
jgi:unsaturated rhamnogalacturonyl hydrolase